MDIPQVTSGTDPNPIARQGDVAQASKDLMAIGHISKSGDLAAAQIALATFQRNLAEKHYGSAATTLFAQNGETNRQLQALQTALQSNDLATAQSASQSLVQAIEKLLTSK